MGTNVSSVVHMDVSGQPLRSYKDELSTHPHYISLQDTTDNGPHFLGDNSTHLLPYTCLPTNGDDRCPLVITLLTEEEININIRVTEPYYPRLRYQTMARIARDMPNDDDPYSYGITVTLRPGINHVAWCASTPINFSSSMRYFPFHRPNIWFLPMEPFTFIQYLAQTDPESPSSPYIPSPYLFASPYPLPSTSHPLSLGIVSSRVPSLLRLSQLAAGATGLYHPAVARIHPTLSMVTFHPIRTSLFRLE
jgi:hypothetical protein